MISIIKRYLDGEWFDKPAVFRAHPGLDKPWWVVGPGHPRSTGSRARRTLT